MSAACAEKATLSAEKTRLVKRKCFTMRSKWFDNFAVDPFGNLSRYFVSMCDDEAVAVGAFGDSTNVSHTFQPSGLALLSNSP
jgi:hypothetical protein